MPVIRSYLILPLLSTSYQELSYSTITLCQLSGVILFYHYSVPVIRSYLILPLLCASYHELSYAIITLDQRSHTFEIYQINPPWHFLPILLDFRVFMFLLKCEF